MEATKDFLDSVPADASVYFSDRTNPQENFSSTWGEQVTIKGFAEQFIGAKVETYVDDGEGDSVDLRDIAEGKTIYSMTIEEGEHTDHQGTCAALQMVVTWADGRG